MDSGCCNISAPAAGTLDVPEIIRGLDELYENNRESEAGAYLALWRERAKTAGDWRAELSIVSEQLGYCRRSADRALALECVETAQRIIAAHSMADTVSAATVLLNAATTLKCFGLADRSLPIFGQVMKVFDAMLSCGDYRFAGLYNNMALSYADLGDTATAEQYFLRAVEIVKHTTAPGNDLAVTYCNMAEMYGALDSEDKRIEQYLDMAYESLCTPGLPLDGYHAFTISKCLPSFDQHGFFLYAKELRERMEHIRGK